MSTEAGSPLYPDSASEEGRAMTERIRWEPNGYDGFLGYVSTFDPWLFQLCPRPSRWELMCTLPGKLGANIYDTDPDALKAEAEHWLEEFVSSLGAVFPDPGLPGCFCCGKPVTGTPVTDPDDPLRRTWCSDECLDASAEGAYEQRYRPGVAT